MAARDVLKNFNLFIDSKGYAGQVSEFTPPALKAKTEEFRGGGMDAGVDLPMGIEKLMAGFVLISYSKDVLTLFGLAPGNVVPMEMRGALEGFDGVVTAVKHTMRGRLNSLDAGTAKPGEMSPLTGEMSLTYYKLTHGTTVIQEIDVENMIHKVNGVDVLAQKRSAIGL